MNTKKIIVGLLVFITTTVYVKSTPDYAPPNSFRKAKPIIYQLTQQIHNYTLYCNCPIEWTANGKKGTPNLKACGYQVRKRQSRAERVEIEHIVPASVLAKGMPCWKKRGRKECVKNAKYNLMSSNLYNLWSAVGEVNADRSNYYFGIRIKALRNLWTM